MFNEADFAAVTMIPLILHFCFMFTNIFKSCLNFIICKFQYSPLIKINYITKTIKINNINSLLII